MSVLTKVFVVLLTVASIALCMLVLASFAHQENWKASAEGYKAAALDEQAKARTISANAQLEKTRAIAQHQDDLARMGRLEAQVEEMQLEVANTDRELADAKASFKIEQGTAAKLTEEQKLMRSAFNKEAEFGAKIAKRNSELERRNIDLNERVKELTVGVEMARSQIRALQQQLAASGNEATYASAHQIPGTVEANIPSVALMPAPAMASAIRGEVTAIDGNLASISIGSADGVAPGMKFLIYRRGGSGARPQYLGTLRVTRVQADEAGGRLEQSTGDIRPGDAVRDEASFAMRN